MSPRFGRSGRREIGWSGSGVSDGIISAMRQGKRQFLRWSLPLHRRFTSEAGMLSVVVIDPPPQYSPWRLREIQPFIAPPLPRYRTLPLPARLFIDPASKRVDARFASLAHNRSIRFLVLVFDAAQKLTASRARLLGRQLEGGTKDRSSGPCCYLHGQVDVRQAACFTPPIGSERHLPVGISASFCNILRFNSDPVS